MTEYERLVCINYDVLGIECKRPPIIARLFGERQTEDYADQRITYIKWDGKLYILSINGRVSPYPSQAKGE